MGQDLGQLDLLAEVDQATARLPGLPVAQGESDVWGRPETALFVQHLRHGALSDALEVLGGLPMEMARSVLNEAGFSPRPSGGRTAMLESVQADLIRAAQLGCTGHDLRQVDGVEPLVSAPSVDAGDQFPPSLMPRDFSAALKALQAVYGASEVEIGVAGPEPLDQRAALLFIGAQALERGVSGFGIPGVAGKFQLPDSVDLTGLQALYHGAAGVIADTSVRKVLPTWANGQSVIRVSDYVPEEVAAVLRGPVSMAGIASIEGALSDGSLRQFAGDHGLRMAAQVLHEQQGIDLLAPPIEQKIENEGLALVEMKPRGAYAGPVVAKDHQHFAVRASASGALIVALRDLPDGVKPPALGDRVLIKAGQDGQIANLSVTGRQQSVGR